MSALSAVPCYGNTPLTVAFAVTRADARLLEVPSTDADITAGDLTAVVSTTKDGAAAAHASLGGLVATYVATQQEWRVDLSAAQMDPAVWNALVAPLYLVLLYQTKPIGFVLLAYSQFRDMLAP